MIELTGQSLVPYTPLRPRHRPRFDVHLTLHHARLHCFIAALMVAGYRSRDCQWTLLLCSVWCCYWTYTFLTEYNFWTNPFWWDISGKKHVMTNLHYGLNFNLKFSKVAKFSCEMLLNRENIASQSWQILYHVWDEIGAKVVGFSASNTFIYKFANFARLYFCDFTTSRN